MAEKKFFVDINLQGSALTNAKIGTNSGIGSTEGAFGYDSAAHRLQYFDGSATKEVANLSDISAVTGGLILQGGYDADTNTPNITDGTALKGFFWVVTVAGSFLGESVQIGDSIIAKIDEAGATLSDWLILQGNVVIATDTVDGISRLATQTEANDGTEGGAVVITPATLQGKIDAQITPEINSKLPLSGGVMEGNIDMNSFDLNGVEGIQFDRNGTGNIGSNEKSANGVFANELIVNNIGGKSTSTVNSLAELDFQYSNGKTITNLPAPTNDGDATNKIYVDTAQTNAEAYADSLAPNYDAAGAAATAESNANAYTDARSTAVFVATGDWTDAGGYYYKEVNHGIAGNVMVTTLYNDRPAEFDYDQMSGIVTLYSNILPTFSVQVNIMKVS